MDSPLLFLFVSILVAVLAYWSEEKEKVKSD